MANYPPDPAYEEHDVTSPTVSEIDAWLDTSWLQDGDGDDPGCEASQDCEGGDGTEQRSVPLFPDICILEREWAAAGGQGTQCEAYLPCSLGGSLASNTWCPAEAIGSSAENAQAWESGISAATTSWSSDSNSLVSTDAESDIQKQPSRNDTSSQMADGQDGRMQWQQVCTRPHSQAQRTKLSARLRDRPTSIIHDRTPCPLDGCKRTYKRKSRLKVHLRTVHDAIVRNVPAFWRGEETMTPPRERETMLRLSAMFPEFVLGESRA